MCLNYDSLEVKCKSPLTNPPECKHVNNVPIHE